MAKVVYTKVFNRKKKKLSKGETALIQVTAYLNKEYKYFSTGLYITPDQWKNKEVVKHDKATAYNSKIQSLINELEEFEREVTKSGRTFQLRMFDELRGNDKRDHTFIGFIKKEISLRTNVEQATLDGYEYLLRMLNR